MSWPDPGIIRARHGVPAGYRVHGHAIVSADDFIAGVDGLTPPALRNEADWRRFQAALNEATVTVLGRLGHEANPNYARRRRLVLTRRIQTLEIGEGCWWWNPAGMPLAEALHEVAPGGGTIAVPGGQPVFDFFLAVGYDAFDLARAEDVVLGEGTTVFSGLEPGRTANDVLRDAGLVADPAEVLDPAANVTLTVWWKT
ncbi:hypothetical protein [Microbaculum marinisediminis]|uniref:Dihydrofolate reductase n=1 Tax=Microbaculum marinisediminis TaxID=2931392 RepID=A0AAW5QWY9_9HYPH|nr:hypothetical protein [Microbaculum sp. A6E488]MCT8970981.1 hypothetical protein [Microbaculum sp. A6E488]